MVPLTFWNCVYILTIILHCLSISSFESSSASILSSLVGQTVSLPTMWDTQVWSLGREDPLEKEMATHSTILAWKIPWTEDPGDPRSWIWGRKESDTTERLHFHFLLPFRQFCTQARPLISFTWLLITLETYWGQFELWAYSPQCC